MRLIHLHAPQAKGRRQALAGFAGSQDNPAGAVQLGSDLPCATARARVAACLAAHPMAWIVARGPAVAVFHRVAADHLSLRIAGAVLFDPADWVGADGTIALGQDPLPFPSVIVGACRSEASSVEFALAWGASLVSRVDRTDLLGTPAVRDMILRREASLHPAAPRPALSPQP
ncbi:hypothetical protein [Paragemmobacter straminiformis]|uniref:Uncharacterized protein n=1 Tax=Paragemmobacter straminiformis TaxID=2045119 RepID=A0A842ID08_9RHOB|nr:hypothetical protein [Gemmobacter straminiformis]MBC2836838.1 hypothetical protein [Gemmobacter straminiformis]